MTSFITTEQAERLIRAVDALRPQAEVVKVTIHADAMWRDPDMQTRIRSEMNRMLTDVRRTA